ncbi:MAG: hypothetical protein AUH28_08690 [Acidobacteria bacterium 13_1_40CM_56_16]|nr:MAG: hypothetical protein AUH28_08690 [Acidobacteria bacterium 13_1_40CM_56_16]
MAPETRARALGAAAFARILHMAVYNTPSRGKVRVFLPIAWRGANSAKEEGPWYGVPSVPQRLMWMKTKWKKAKF